MLSGNLQNFILDQTARGLYADGITDLGADQCAAYGGFVGNLALQTVGFCRADDFVGLFFFVLKVKNPNGTADIDLVGTDLVLDYDFDILPDILELGDPGFDISLLILGRIVFRVFGKVALLSGFLDLLSDFLSLVDLEVMQLIFVPFQSFISKNIFLFFHGLNHSLDIFSSF